MEFNNRHELRKIEPAVDLSRQYFTIAVEFTNEEGLALHLIHYRDIIYRVWREERVDEESHRNNGE